MLNLMSQHVDEKKEKLNERLVQEELDRNLDIANNVPDFPLLTTSIKSLVITDDINVTEQS